MATSAKIAAAKHDWRKVLAAFKSEFGITLPNDLKVKFYGVESDPIYWLGSYFDSTNNSLALCTRYPPRLGDRAAIYAYELGHVLKHNFNLARFADWEANFTESQSDVYQKTPSEIMATLNPKIGLHERRCEVLRIQMIPLDIMWESRRPHGEPSAYGQKKGGEERFCEVLRLMYEHDFILSDKLSDIKDLWRTVSSLLMKCQDSAKRAKAPKLKTPKMRAAKPQALDFDFNECPQCHSAKRCYPPEYTHCAMGHELVLPAPGGIAIWRLGEVDTEVLGGICAGLEKLLRIPVVLQPALVDRRPGEMKAWRNGILDAVIILQQIAARHQPDSLFTLFLTEDFVAPNGYEICFSGFDWIPGKGAMISLDNLRHECAWPNDWADPALITTFALTHCVPLFDHNYGAITTGFQKTKKD